jgi:cytochrome c2
MLGRIVISLVSLLIPIAVALVGSHCVFPIGSYEVSPTIGGRIFRAKCSSCHSVSSESASYGPSLVRLLERAGNQVRGMSAEEYILSSIIDPNAYRAPGSSGEMPALMGNGLSRADVLHLASYLCSLGEEPVSYRAILEHGLAMTTGHDTKTEPRVVSLKELERGHQLYFYELKCASCHPLVDYPGHDLLAPSLVRAGLHDKGFLRDSILNPSKHIPSNYESWIVAVDGNVVSGRRLSGAADNLRLIRAGEQGRGLVIQDISQRTEDADGIACKKSDVSAMPTFNHVLTESDTDSLVSFLSILK